MHLTISTKGNLSAFYALHRKAFARALDKVIAIFVAFSVAMKPVSFIVALMAVLICRWLHTERRCTFKY